MDANELTNAKGKLVAATDSTWGINPDDCVGLCHLHRECQVVVSVVTPVSTLFRHGPLYQTGT